METHSFDLVKADICDINVPLVVHRQSMGYVEHSLSERVEGVSGVRIEKENRVLIDHFLLLQFVVWSERAARSLTQRSD